MTFPSDPVKQLRRARGQQKEPPVIPSRPPRQPVRLNRVHFALIGFFATLLGGILLVATLSEIPYDSNTSWLLITAALVGSSLGLAAHDGR